MVSPLQTWQHTEPKGLWSTLGGLAIVAHAGVLGLLLPYVASTMKSGQEGSPAAIPIELIEVADVDSELLPSQLTAASSITTQTTSLPAEPVSEQPITDTTAETSTATSSTEVLTVQSDEAIAEKPLPAEEIAEPVTPTDPAENNNSAPTTESESSKSEETPPDSSQSETTPAEENEDSLPEQPESEETVPVISGEPIPLPGEAVTGEEGDQIASLSLVAHDYVPDELRIDRFAAILPTPSRQTTSSSVRPQDIGCGKVGELLQTQFTYRVGIDAAGTIISAAPWTGSNEALSLNASEEAIVCLLKQSKFEFVPAEDEEGSAIANSDLLLTFTLALDTD
ncbi:MAG: hypothetical protein ACFB16_21740 [Phormidesmis sp.]